MHCVYKINHNYHNNSLVPIYDLLTIPIHTNISLISTHKYILDYTVLYCACEARIYIQHSL
jgi:hypothetical protein